MNYKLSDEAKNEIRTNKTLMLFISDHFRISLRSLERWISDDAVELTTLDCLALFNKYSKMPLHEVIAPQTDVTVNVIFYSYAPDRTYIVEQQPLSLTQTAEVEP